MSFSRRSLWPLAGLLLLPLVALTGNTACDGQCSMPTDHLTLHLPDVFEGQCEHLSRLDHVEGVFHPQGKGFVLDAGGDSFLFPDADAAVPNGTFVHIDLACIHFLDNDLGRLLVIQNLPSLHGVPNPVESGSRVWFILAAGGAVLLPDTLPIEYALEEVCHQDDTDGGYRSAEAIVLIDGSKAVMVRPGETREFAVSRGDQAGKYTLQNVNVVFSEHDVPIDVNFRIRRAD